MDVVLAQLRGLTDVWVECDIVLELIKLYVRPGLEIDNSPYKLLQQCPTLCGIWLFVLRYLTQSVSIGLANAFGSIISVAHLYNALRREETLKSAWKDMEVVRNLQSSAILYAGETPTAPEEYLRQLALCMGRPDPTLAQDETQAKSKAPVEDARLLSTCPFLPQLLAGRYAANKSSLSTDLDNVQLYFKALYSKPEDDGLSAPSEYDASDDFETRVKRRWTLSASDFLEALTCSINDDGLCLTFDYFAMHRLCWSLLQNINKVIASQLESLIGAGYLQHKDQLPSIVWLMFEARFGEKKADDTRFMDVFQTDLENLCAKGMFVGAAGAMLKSMLRTGGLVSEIIKRRFTYSLESESEDEEDEESDQETLEG